MEPAGVASNDVAGTVGAEPVVLADVAITFSAGAEPPAELRVGPAVEPCLVLGMDAALAIAVPQSLSRLRRSSAAAIAIRTRPTIACWVAQGLLLRMAAADGQDAARHQQE
jgi:hypothetical protein